MAVAFVATTSTSGASVTSLTPPAFDVGSAADRAVAAGFSGSGNIVGMTMTLGADPAMSAIAGTPGAKVTMHGRVTTLTGLQSVTVSWTDVNDAVVGAVVASGVDQTTPHNNGTNNATSEVIITSAAGDLTMSIGKDLFGATSITAGQTSRWAIASVGPNNLAGGGDTAAGAATVTHTWTSNGSDKETSGCNWKAAAVTGHPAARRLGLVRDTRPVEIGRAGMGVI